MKRIKLLFGIGVAAVAISSAWQFGASEVKNVQLQDDMRDLASQLDTRIGFSVPKTDEDYRNAVIRKAEGYGIELAPEQVTVERTRSGEKQAIYLAADYRVEIKLPGFSVPLHFTPSGGEKAVEKILDRTVDQQAGQKLQSPVEDSRMINPRSARER